MVEAFSVVTNKIDSKRENATVFFKNIEKKRRFLVSAVEKSRGRGIIFSILMLPEARRRPVFAAVLRRCKHG